MFILCQRYCQVLQGFLCLEFNNALPPFIKSLVSAGPNYSTGFKATPKKTAQYKNFWPLSFEIYSIKCSGGGGGGGQGGNFL